MRRISQKPSRLLFFTIALAVLAGCAATASKLAVPYEVSFEAATDTNPDNDGRPSPIQITLYELRAPGAFQAADYFSLHNDAQAALGDALISVQRVMLRPGETHVLARPGDVDARLLGVVAAYRDLDASRWRLAIELPESRNTNIYKFWQLSPGKKRIRLVVERDGISIVPPER